MAAFPRERWRRSPPRVTMRWTAMRETFFLGLDLGTTNVKGVALSRGGRVLGSASRSLRSAAPRDGWAEQDPEEVWAAAAAVLAETARAAAPRRPFSLALSGAMHTLLPIASDGSPLAPALIWADRRAASQCLRLRARADLAGLYRRTGCPLQPIYHLSRLRFWLEEAPQLSGRAALFAGLKDLVLHRLTGRWSTDLSTASATGLLDIRECRWDGEALELAGVGAGRLPPLASPLAQAGPLTEPAARQTGLPSGLPVICGAADGALANLGAGAALPGQSVITVGTSGALRLIVPEPLLDADPAQRTWCYLLDRGRWYAGGALNNAGLAVQWIHDNFYAGLPSAGGFERLFEEAGRAPLGAAGLRCLPFFAGERSPYFRADARAAFVGLGWEHGRGHLARAVLEAVALRLADIWEILGAAVGSAPFDGQQAVRLTGAIVRSPLWAQIVCDALGVEMAGLESADASVLGACLLARAASQPGLSLEKLAARIRPSRRWRPDPVRHEEYRCLLEQFRELYTLLIAEAH
jgi:gluconokinase